MNSPCWNKWGNKEPSPRWYHGGLSAAVATILTHPLDLLKVHLQTADTWFGEETCKAAEPPEICRPPAPTEGGSCSQCLQADPVDMCPPNRRPAVLPPEPTSPPARTLTGAFWRVYNTNGRNLTQGSRNKSTCSIKRVRLKYETIRKRTPTTPPARTLTGAFFRVYQTDGLLALYTGLSAAIIRQLIYSTVRFSAYEYAKQYHFKQEKREPTGMELVIMAGVAGAFAGFLGAPAELVNVRMQNDIKIPLTCRRYYNNGIQGMFNVLSCEGITGLFRGAAAASLRAALIGIGQMAVYDLAKRELIKRGQKDTARTQLLAGIAASMIATAIALPIDVVKTRAMAAPASEQVGLLCGAESLYNAYGITGLYRGFVPAMLRILPQTLFTYMVMEQLRTRFGVVES